MEFHPPPRRTGPTSRCASSTPSRPAAPPTISRAPSPTISPTTFGQQFFVETRSGAAGAIGVNSVVATPPDGYNFVITNITMLVLAPIANPKLGYHPERDLTNIAYLGGSPVVLSVNSKSPIKTLADFVAYGKKSGKPLTYSSSGVGSQRAPVRRDLRPQGRHQGRARALQGRGAGPARSRRRTHRVVGADRDVVGRDRFAAARCAASRVTSKQRMPDYPDTPTFAELGHPEFSSADLVLAVGAEGPARRRSSAR